MQYAIFLTYWVCELTKVRLRTSGSFYGVVYQLLIFNRVYNIYRCFNHQFKLLTGQSVFCRYDLVQADLALASFSELSVINLRRLFAHKGSNFMDLQKQIVEKSPPKRKLTTDTIF